MNILLIGIAPTSSRMRRPQGDHTVLAAVDNPSHGSRANDPIRFTKDAAEGQAKGGLPNRDLNSPKRIAVDAARGWVSPDGNDIRSAGQGATGNGQA